MESKIVPIDGAHTGAADVAGTAAPKIAMATITSRDFATAHAVSDVIGSHVNSDGSAGYISTDDLADPALAAGIADEILDRIRLYYDVNNASLPRSQRWSVPQRIPSAAIAEVLARTGDFVRMLSANGDGSVLLLRIRRGRDAGIFKAVDPRDPCAEATAMVTALAPMASTLEVSETIKRLAKDLRLRTVDPKHDCDRRLVYCANGVFDLGDMSFTAYDDPAYFTLYRDEVRLWKLAVSYDPAASTMPEIVTPDGGRWSFDSQLEATFTAAGIDDASREAYIKAVWEMLHFAVRGLNGGFAYWFVNSSGAISGANGKSTVTEVLRQLLGARNVLPTPIEGLGERFALASLPSSAAIVSDESDADVSAVEKASVYKKLATGEPVDIEAKHMNAYRYDGFTGVMVQAMNSAIKISTSGGSLWRRILVLPFEHDFTVDGVNDSVKGDYIRRPEILSAILYRALHMGNLSRISPEVVAACEASKTSVRSESSKVWACMADFCDLMTEWAEACSAKGLRLRIPTRMLYDCYRDRENGWSVKNGFSLPLSYPSFLAELAGWALENKGTWKYLDKSKPSSVNLQALMTAPGGGYNPLLQCYRTSDWCQDHSGIPVPRVNGVKLSATYRGVLEYVG